MGQSGSKSYKKGTDGYTVIYERSESFDDDIPDDDISDEDVKKQFDELFKPAILACNKSDPDRHYQELKNKFISALIKLKNSAYMKHMRNKKNFSVEDCKKITDYLLRIAHAIHKKTLTIGMITTFDDITKPHRTVKSWFAENCHEILVTLGMSCCLSAVGFAFGFMVGGINCGAYCALLLGVCVLITFASMYNQHDSGPRATSFRHSIFEVKTCAKDIDSKILEDRLAPTIDNIGRR